MEKDLRTGKTQVLSSAPVAPQELQRKGIKVYDDGRKSVYAVQSAAQNSQDVLDELSPLEVEKLLRDAAEKKKNLGDVEYHEPVFSSLYSRSSTPNPGEQSRVSPGYNASHVFTKISSPLQLDGNHDSGYENTINMQTDCHGVQGEDSDNMEDLEEPVKLIPVSDSQLGFERNSPIRPNNCKPITMIFMGYKNAESDEEDEEIRAEFVVIGNDERDSEDESSLSYHPQGCHSKIFPPRTHNVYRSEITPSALRKHREEPPTRRETGDLNFSGTAKRITRRRGI